MEFTSIYINNYNVEFACTAGGVSLSGNCTLNADERVTAAKQATEDDPFKGFKTLLQEKMGVK